MPVAKRTEREIEGELCISSNKRIIAQRIIRQMLAVCVSVNSLALLHTEGVEAGDGGGGREI